jgi:hypothetical protein
VTLHLGMHAATALCIYSSSYTCTQSTQQVSNAIQYVMLMLSDAACMRALLRSKHVRCTMHLTQSHIPLVPSNIFIHL